MLFQRFSRDSLRALPWKNGGGVTREIVCQPPGADTTSFDWRVSIAHIESNGPFSPFPGIDRVITLLEGPGVRLRSALNQAGGIDHLLNEPLRPFAFSGDRAVDAELLGGDCHDFNVMTRRGVCRAQVRVYQSPKNDCTNQSGSESIALEASPAGLLMAVKGTWHVNQEALDSGQGLWWTQSAQSWSVSSQDENAALLAVLIFPAAS